VLPAAAAARRHNVLVFGRLPLLAGVERVEEAALVLDGVGEQVPVRLADLFDRGAHPAGEREQRDAGRDAERPVGVAQGVGAAVFQAGRPDGGCPFVASPLVQVQIAAPDAGRLIFFDCWVAATCCMSSDPLSI
jgi:hypothetical protein